MKYQKEKEYLFIDGGCLRAAVKKICKDMFGCDDVYRPFMQNIIMGYDKVFYYDAVSALEYNEETELYSARVQPEHDKFDFYRSLDRVHVSLGSIVGKNRRQKGVDVKLAVDMMSHAFRGKIERVTLFAGDADFIPLVEALVEQGLHVTLWHPPQANKKLKGAADTCRQFCFKNNFESFTMNNASPAFGVIEVGPGTLEISSSGVSSFITFESYIGTWDGQDLLIFKPSRVKDAADYHCLRAPGASLKRALISFQEIFGWEVVETGEQWVKSL